MPRKLRPALVRGQRTRYWKHWDGHLILRDPASLTETDVPIAHLADAALMDEHYARLEGKSWVIPAMIQELREMADGAWR